jgi:protein-L-isoaspartate(D-aspartate) O-methyltransferase
MYQNPINHISVFKFNKQPYLCISHKIFPDMIKIVNIIIFISVMALSDDLYRGARERMVRDQIENRGVKDKAVLESMRNVPRHMFVPDELQSRAYEDRPLPIGYGQTISQPYIVAYMTEVVNVGRDDKVLEIGAGSGYQAAVLAGIVDKVYTIEIVPELGQVAANRMKNLGYDNVVVKTGDGFYGWEEHAPFDAIVVTAAAEYIPPPLIQQLKEGGKMVIPIGSPFMVQNLMLVEKRGGKVRTRTLFPVKFVPFRRAGE